MSRESVRSDWAELLEDRELAGSLEAELFGLLAREGRLRRAARELAEEEHAEGAHVDESEPVVERARLAAQDRALGSSRTYGDGRYRLRLRRVEDGRELEQLDGPPGATVVLEGQHHPLQPGTVVRLGVGELPAQVEILDLRGRRRVLDGG